MLSLFVIFLVFGWDTFYNRCKCWDIDFNVIVVAVFSQRLIILFLFVTSPASHTLFL